MPEIEGICHTLLDNIVPRIYINCNYYLKSSCEKINGKKNDEMFRKIVNFEIGKKQIFSCCGIFAKRSSADKNKTPIKNEKCEEVTGKILSIYM